MGVVAGRKTLHSPFFKSWGFLVIATLLAQLTDSWNRETLLQRFFRQFSLPKLAQGAVECAMFGCVFLAAAFVSLDFGIQQMLPGLVPLVLIMMISMVMSGVYRRDIMHDIMNVYIHSLYGFVLAVLPILIYLHVFMPRFLDEKFIFFFLFFAFFVTGTLRPLTSGTDFMDGGGRRIN
ncbi:MAG: hypothetical protein KTR35_22220 [Gammaproteobacteria bacterium]|nr:hypothetical protein [Gammaproteobacteria bacterium]